MASAQELENGELCILNVTNEQIFKYKKIWE